MKQLMLEISEQAYAANRPRPVIRSDRYAIMSLVAALANDIGCRVGDLRTPNHATAEFMFDGIRFEVE